MTKLYLPDALYPLSAATGTEEPTNIATLNEATAKEIFKKPLELCSFVETELPLSAKEAFIAALTYMHGPFGGPATSYIGVYPTKEQAVSVTKDTIYPRAGVLKVTIVK